MVGTARLIKLIFALNNLPGAKLFFLRIKIRDDPLSVSVKIGSPKHWSSKIARECDDGE